MITHDEFKALSSVFEAEDASKDANLEHYLIDLKQIKDINKENIIVIHGPAGIGKSSLLKLLSNTKKVDSTCKVEYQQLNRLVDTIQNWGMNDRCRAVQYAIDFWILTEIAKRSYNKLTSGGDAGIRKIATELGLDRRDTIEQIATFALENVEQMFSFFNKIFEADPAILSMSNITLSILNNENANPVTRINQITDKMKASKIFSGLYFQIDEIDDSRDNLLSDNVRHNIQCYFQTLYDLTDSGIIAPYAIAINSSAFSIVQGLGAKYMGKLVAINCWDTEKLMQLVKERFNYAIQECGSDISFESFLTYFSLDDSCYAKPCWEYESNDSFSLVGLLNRPRYTVNLWRYLLLELQKENYDIQNAWTMHMEYAATNGIYHLNSKFNGISSLIIELSNQAEDCISETNFNDIRDNLARRTRNSINWIAPHVSQLANEFKAAGFVAIAENRDIRIRKNILQVARNLLPIN